MFATTYQNGEYGIEVFTPSGNDPFKACKLINEGNIKKLYDRSIKGYMISMEKESTSTSLQFPKSSKGTLLVTHPILVVQLQLHPERSFSMELIVVDTEQQRRRFHLSTNFKEVNANHLHVCMPWLQPNRDHWTNVAINLEQLVSVFQNGKSAVGFLNLESISIQPFCKIRKIFALPLKYFDDEDTGLMIPPKFDFTSGVEYSNWVFTCNPEETVAAPKGTTSHPTAAAPSATVTTTTTNTPSMFSVVGKKLPRHDPVSAVYAQGASQKSLNVSGVNRVIEATSKRHKSIPGTTQKYEESSLRLNPWAPVKITAVTSTDAVDATADATTTFEADATADNNAADKLTPRVPHLGGSHPTVSHTPAIFSGRLKQKLTAAAAAHQSTIINVEPCAHVEIQAREVTQSDANANADADTSQQESTVESPRENPSADCSALSDGDSALHSNTYINKSGNHPIENQPSSPSPADSGEASTLTETEASVQNTNVTVLNHVGGDGEDVDDGDDDVLGRYLLLRQNMKRGEDVHPNELQQSQQSVHDYSLVEEYVSSYKLHQKLHSVRESQFIAEEEAQLSGRLHSADANTASRGIAAESADALAENETGESWSDMDLNQIPHRSHGILQKSLAAGTGEKTPVKTRTFVDAAVSPMPMPLSSKEIAPHARFSHTGSLATSTPMPMPSFEEERDKDVEGENMDVDVEVPVEKLDEVPVSIAAAMRSSEDECSHEQRPNISPRTSSTTHTKLQQRQKEDASSVLSPFSEAVAFIENSRPSTAPAPASYSYNNNTNKSKVGVRPSTGGNPNNLDCGAQSSKTGKSSPALMNEDSTFPVENINPNRSLRDSSLNSSTDLGSGADVGRSIHYEEEGSDFKRYKSRSSEMVKRYEESIDALLMKLEQKGTAPVLDANTRSPLSTRSAAAVGNGRSANTATALSTSPRALASTPLPEKRKRAIKARVAGLLRQVAQAEMEYIAEFGFDAFEKDVGFFEDNLPGQRR